MKAVPGPGGAEVRIAGLAKAARWGSNASRLESQHTRRVDFARHGGRPHPAATGGRRRCRQSGAASRARRFGASATTVGFGCPNCQGSASRLADSNWRSSSPHTPFRTPRSCEFASPGWPRRLAGHPENLRHGHRPTIRQAARCPPLSRRSGRSQLWYECALYGSLDARHRLAGPRVPLVLIEFVGLPQPRKPPVTGLGVGRRRRDFTWSGRNGASRAGAHFPWGYRSVDHYAYWGSHNAGAVELHRDEAPCSKQPGSWVAQRALRTASSSRSPSRGRLVCEDPHLDDRRAAGLHGSRLTRTLG